MSAHPQWVCTDKDSDFFKMSSGLVKKSETGFRAEDTKQNIARCYFYNYSGKNI